MTKGRRDGSKHRATTTAVALLEIASAWHGARFRAPRSPSAGGRIVKNTGDGALVEFASAVDAVRCALENQREIAACNEATARLADGPRQHARKARG